MCEKKEKKEEKSKEGNEQMIHKTVVFKFSLLIILIKRDYYFHTLIDL